MSRQSTIPLADWARVVTLLYRAEALVSEAAYLIQPRSRKVDPCVRALFKLASTIRSVRYGAVDHRMYAEHGIESMDLSREGEA